MLISFSMNSMQSLRTCCTLLAKYLTDMHKSNADISRKILSQCLFRIAAEGGCPDTTFIEDAVQELLKTRRILKCSYPYGFFLEPKSTKKEIFELMQVIHGYIYFPNGTSFFMLAISVFLPFL